MSFEVIKWAYNKTFVKIMKNAVHFRENSRLNKSDVIFFYLPLHSEGNHPRLPAQ
jgi:hypothetical protein